MSFPVSLRSPCLTAIFPAACLTAIAQSVAPVKPAENQKSEEIVTLSPFAVSGAADQGYVATTTLAGTRLRTDIRDTPVALSVLTEDFLNDIAATNAESMAPFLPSTEVLSLIGGADSGNAAKPGDSFQVRGFSTATRTRNFFQTAGENDRYLTDRVTFSRGPNALLFGIGNPGGAIHLSTNRANLGKNHGSLDYYYDSYDSHRLSLDQNFVLVKDRLAVRADLLWTNTNTFRDPSAEKKKGAYLTTTWNPFNRDGRTQVRFNFEYAKTDRIAGRPWAPFDLFSTWVNAGGPLYDNRLTARPATLPAAGNPYVITEDLFVDIKGQRAISAFRTSRSTGYNSYVRAAGPLVNGVESTFNSITRDFVSLNPLDLLRKRFGSDAGLETWLAGLGPLRSIPEQWRGGKTITVPMETWINGDLDSYGKKFNAFSLFLEHRLGDNLFIEAAGNLERNRVRNVTQMRSTDISITYDPNLYLPTGAPNPYAGMPYVGQLGFGTDEHNKNPSYEYRLTASYLLDLSRRKFLKIFDFGRHNLAALWNSFGDETDALQDRTAVTKWDGRWIDQNSPLAAAARNLGTGWGPAQLKSRFYLLPGQSPYVPEPWIPITGDPNVMSADWATFLSTYGSTTVRSLAFSTQSFFLNDRLVFTGGWRRDQLTEVQNQKVPYDATNADPTAGNYFGEANFEASRANRTTLPTKRWDNKSYGAVFHVLRNWKSVNTASLFYNHATNVSGATARYDINFKEVSPLNGLGRDYGVRLSLFHGKLVGSYTLFETTQTDNFINTNFQFGRAQFNEVYPILEIVEPASEVLVRQSRTNVAWTPIYDSVTKGREVELVWNATKNLRMRATYSTHENIISRFAGDIEAFLTEHRPIWQKFIDANLDRNFTGARIPASPTREEQAKIDAEYVRKELADMDIELPLKKGYNGIPTNGIPYGQGSLTMNYTLPNRGWLTGFSTGGSVRYRGKAPLNFKTAANGAVDLTQAFEASPSTKVDVNIGYRRKLWNGRIGWRVQAMVRNVFDEVDPILLAAEWDRTTERFVVKRNLLVDPRSFVLTSSFTW